MRTNILHVLCRYTGNYNNKTLGLMKTKGKPQAGHGLSTAKWCQKYSECDDNMPSDVQSEVLLSICTVQTALIVSQLILLLQRTLVCRHQQCLAYAVILCGAAELVKKVDKKRAKAIKSAAKLDGVDRKGAKALKRQVSCSVQQTLCS